MAPPQQASVTAVLKRPVEHLRGTAGAEPAILSLFHTCIPSPQRPLLPLLLRRTYCSFVLLSSLAFDNWPLPRSEALKKARLSQEDGGIRAGVSPVFYPPQHLRCFFQRRDQGPCLLLGGRARLSTIEIPTPKPKK